MTVLLAVRVGPVAGGRRARGWVGVGPTHPRPVHPGATGHLAGCGATGHHARVTVRSSDPDRGAASLWVLAFGLVLVLAGGVGAAVGAATVARHRAQVAADLGALAGAARAVEGGAVACARAGEFAGANGGRVTACRVEALDLVVTVEVDVTGVPGFTGVATASARAGPTEG